MRRLAALAGMVATLALARWFDSLYEATRVTATSADSGSLVWLSAATEVVLAALLLIVAWFAISRSGGSRLIFSLFVLVGVLLVFSFFLTGQLSWLPSSLLQPLGALVPVSPRSLLFHASAFITVIGLIGLVARPRP